MPQNPPTPDINLDDIPDDITADIPDSDKGLLSRVWSKVNTPLTNIPSELGAKAANVYTPDPDSQALADRFHLGGMYDAYEAANKGVAGMLGSLGDSATTPLSIATMGSGMLESGAAKLGMPLAAKGLNYAGRALSLPVAGEGLYNTYNAPTIGGKLAGAAQTFLGGMGAIHAPSERISSDIANDTGSIAPNVAVNLDREIPPVQEQTGTIRSAKPKVRLNSDGTFIDSTTGQKFDKSGVPINDVANTGPMQWPKLPKDLQGAKPSYSRGTDRYNLTFENDIDRSLYIIAQTNQSKRDADYLKFVTDATGLDKDTVRNLGKVFKSHIKEFLKTQEPGDVTIPSIWKPEDLAQDSVKSNYVPLPPKPTVGIEEQLNASIANGRDINPSNSNITPPTQTGNVPPNIPPVNGININDIPYNARPDMNNPGPKLGDVTNKLGWGHEALQFPRAIMASTDFSAPLRQGLNLIHRPEYWRAFDDMFKSFGSEGGFQAVKDSIAQLPTQKSTIPILKGGKPTGDLTSLADAAGLYSAGKNIGNQEEMYMSRIAGGHLGGITGKIINPVMNLTVGRSERAYVGFLNKLRADTFESMIKDAGASNDLTKAKAIAEYINTATGRGSLGAFDKIAPQLNSFLFAPRLMAARLKMLNPAYYYRAPSEVRREALKNLFAVAGLVGTTGALAKGMGADVNLDPSNSDFGKIRFGNTRLDMMGGYQQYIVAAYRLMNSGIHNTTGLTQGKQTSSTTGKESLTNPVDTATRFARGKLAPVPSFLVDMWQGKDMGGNPVTLPSAIGHRMIPMLAQDLYDMSQDPNVDPGIKAAMSIPATFGAGLQTYGPPQK